MVQPIFSYLQNGNAKYVGQVDDYAAFIIQKQLKDRPLWKKFINVFRSREDAADGGWRGEYFGKMMRGACLSYRYRPDEELYQILFDTVQDLISTQDEQGRITTYPSDNEYFGWDMWVRKYVLVGCLYFYGICKDEAFKAQLVSAMQKHADYILSTLGEDKLPILETSQWWGALNACSILEPMVELYKLTKADRYLQFAEYILSTGCCKGGNILKLAEEGVLFPYQYPAVKAYEMMSVFEGTLAYYEVTGKAEYLHIAEKFVKAVKDSDITVIGCAGCTHELFDNSAVKQAEDVEDGHIMQETCVTVTWMRLLERLLRLTGKAFYAEEIERSALNALYGSINVYGNKQYGMELKTYLDGVPFDSYSPLVFQKRGVGIGGFRAFAEGGYYGCCACIGAAGTALFPLNGVMRTEGGFVCNEYFAGTATDDGVTLHISQNEAPMYGAKLKIELSAPKTFTLKLRIPAWSNAPTVSVNGETTAVEKGYYDLTKTWQNGDEVELAFHPMLRAQTLGGKTAFTYGGLVLARDEQKESGDIAATFTPVCKNGEFAYTLQTPCKGESVRLLLQCKEGEVLLTDYASCGKHWLEDRCRISAWLNVANA